MKNTEIRDYISVQAHRIGIPIPELILTKRFTRTLGEACLHRHAVKLNRKFIHKTTEIYAKSVILHELIHLKNWIENQSQYHDKNFRQMCDWYGCHSASAFTKKEKKKVKVYHISDGSKNYVKGDIAGKKAKMNKMWITKEELEAVYECLGDEGQDEEYSNRVRDKCFAVLKEVTKRGE